jgi:hypothetical protein
MALLPALCLKSNAGTTKEGGIKRKKISRMKSSIRQGFPLLSRWSLPLGTRQARYPEQKWLLGRMWLPRQPWLPGQSVWCAAGEELQASRQELFSGLQQPGERSSRQCEQYPLPDVRRDGQPQAAQRQVWRLLPLLSWLQYDLAPAYGCGESLLLEYAQVLLRRV